MKMFIINGSGGVGKNTFVELVSAYAKVYEISTVDIVKKAARVFGWNGGKTEKDRKFLSDLKLLADDYSNHSMKYVAEQYEKVMKNGSYDYMFVHCREPLNIADLQVKFDCISILVKKSNIKHIISNMADRDVFDYKYDLYLNNNGTLKELEMKAKKFALHYKK